MSKEILSPTGSDHDLEEPKETSHKTLRLLKQDQSDRDLTSDEVSFYADSVSPSLYQMQGGMGLVSAMFVALLGAVGAIASVMLLLSELEHKRNPGLTLSCSINAVVDCLDSMNSWQGHLVFGLPNSIFGIGGFAALIALAVAFARGARFRRPIWLGMAVVVSFAMLVVLWFLFQSTYVLRSLCPYCLVVWATTITLFWFWWAMTIRGGATPQKPLKGYRRFLVSYWWLVALATFILIFLIVVMTFGIYALF